MAAERILVVEDEAEIADVVRAYLERDGFDVSVESNAAAALASVASYAPALMILDVGLPEMNGFDVYRKAAESGRIPTIFLTGRSDEVDRIVGLELGADDYVVKPFSPRELVARVRAVLRRTSEPVPRAGSNVMHVHDLVIDGDAHEVRAAGKKIELTPAEFRILSALAAEPGRVFTRAQLLDKVNDDGEIFERTLDRHINNLRKKLEPHPQRPVYVITVYGIGYKLRK